jgi:hypothetical protein
MRLHKGALFYREELGTAEILVGAVVVPKALTKQIISPSDAAAVVGRTQFFQLHKLTHTEV